ncbi:MAG: pyruvate kinase, partial [Anaerolineae bacterium]
MLRTKIVCTIGPASREPDTLVQLIRAGMNVARLNMSHGDRDFHASNVKRVREAASRVGRPVAVLVDLQGPKLRVGQMGDGVLLPAGSQVVLTTEDVVASPEKVPVQFKRLPLAVRPGDPILLDDGLLELVVRGITDVAVTCQVVTGGMLTSNKGMNLPKADLSIASITEKDQEDLRFALEQGADWIALSFVRKAKEVYDLKDMIRRYGPAGRATPVVAKIEKPEAVENIDSIIAAADGIMVARGDLGIETSPEAVPMVQKSIIRKCNLAGVPVITATQMLDSMIRNPRPTRAEASDVANAILDGTDAIMLSGETAVGKYPVRTVQTMARIAALVEEENESKRSLPVTSGDSSISDA